MNELKAETVNLKADTSRELLAVQEVIERIEVAEVLVEHLLYRKETRWPGYQSRVDFPDRKKEWRKFVNSRLRTENNELEIIERKYKSLGDYAAFKDYDQADFYLEYNL